MDALHGSSQRGAEHGAATDVRRGVQAGRRSRECSSLFVLFFSVVVCSCYPLALVGFVNTIAPCVLCFGEESEGSMSCTICFGAAGS